MIDHFRGEYRWLSNFWLCDIPSEFDKPYPSSESAYQAAKCANLGDKAPFLSCTPGQAKRLGKKIKVRVDWDEMKLGIMLDILRLKFAPNTELAMQLLATGDEELVEKNSWHDVYWGICNGVGENWLGRLLMQVRTELRSSLNKFGKESC